MFTDTGVITIAKDEDVEIDDDALMECALEAGAADFIAEDEYYEIRTETDDLSAVAEALRAAGYEIAEAEVTKLPSTYVTLSTDDDIKYMNLLLEYLDDDDDVTDVYHNWEN
jgi:transcriptional/translational regulatory protein YebC/TACO1